MRAHEHVQHGACTIRVYWSRRLTNGRALPRVACADCGVRVAVERCQCNIWNRSHVLSGGRLTEDTQRRTRHTHADRAHTAGDTRTTHIIHAPNLDTLSHTTRNWGPWLRSRSGNLVRRGVRRALGLASHESIVSHAFLFRALGSIPLERCRLLMRSGEPERW